MGAVQTVHFALDVLRLCVFLFPVRPGPASGSRAGAVPGFVCQSLVLPAAGLKSRKKQAFFVVLPSIGSCVLTLGSSAFIMRSSL